MNIPENFISKMKTLLEDEYEDFIRSFDQERNYGLRINTLKIQADDFLKISPFEMQKIPWTKEGFYFGKEDRPSKQPYYYAGLYYIQEPSAMGPAELLGIRPGDKVLDLCAAPGGKSTQAACKLRDNGLLVSNDISGKRIKALMKNIELFGIKNAVITNENPEKLANKFPGFFDKILVDAPCSGEGMFRKDDEASKSWNIHTNEKCSLMQKNILYEASKMLKPEGYILYSTCTFSPEENECIIYDFLNNNKNFELVNIKKEHGIDRGRGEWCHNYQELDKCARFWPHKLQGEGHFLALLKKKDGEHSALTCNIKSIDENKMKPYYEFCSQNFNNCLEGNFELYGEYLYKQPMYPIPLDGIKVVRPGLFLGNLKKDRFEPSHALALAVDIMNVNNKVNFEGTSYEVIKYLKGETLNIKADKGWNIVCVDNFNLGWAKGSDNTLKNYYPAGWRWV